MTTLIMIPHEANYAESKEVYIEHLMELLETTPLRRDLGNDYFFDEHPSWVNGGDTREMVDGELISVYYTQRLPDGVYHFGGNFHLWSYAFNMYTDEPEIIESVKNAILKNMTRPDYLDQKEPREIKSKEILHTEERIKDWYLPFSSSYKVFDPPTIK